MINRLRHRRGVRTAHGGVYVAVLGLGMLVTMMGVGGLLAVQSQGRAVNAVRDSAHAQLASRAAVDLACLAMRRNATWRESYKSGVWSSEQSFGRGTIQWRLIDEEDDDLANNDSDHVRVQGMATVGMSVRVTSMVVRAVKVPMDVLRTTVHSSDVLSAMNVVNTIGGPVSTNSTLERRATINGDAEALLFTNFSTINGTFTCPAPVKPMPDQSVFDLYKSRATTLPWAGSAGGTSVWTLTWPLLTAGINPTGGATNPEGIYAITVPANGKLVIEISRIKGTLVVQCGDNAVVEAVKPIFWEPHRTDLPALLIKHTTVSQVIDKIHPDPQIINEASIGANLNPPGTPYQGASNTTMLDTYPSQLNGLVHIMMPPLNLLASRVEVADTMNFTGTLLCEGRVHINAKGISLNFSPDLYANPPSGYYSIKMVPDPTTWRRDPAP